MNPLCRSLPGLLPALLLATACAAPPDAQPQWTQSPSIEPQSSGTNSLLIAISIVNRDTVWASGAGGTWVRTTDGGATWTTGVVPGADSLQFRDVHAANGSVAWLLSIGNGPQSRIYHTTDAGATWSLQFTNQDPAAFYDCFGFWDDTHAIAFSDSHDTTFAMLRTDDGATWTRIPPERLPAATNGEGGFASSGTCVVVDGTADAWIGTGASAGAARVLHTADRGDTWSVVQTPLSRGPAAGITTLALGADGRMAAIGGDIGRPDTAVDNVAISLDRGTTWQPAARTPFRGAAYGTSWVPDAPVPALVAVGPGGVAFTTDLAATWTPIDTLNHWGVAFAAPDAGWAVGPGGRISRLRLWTPSPQPR
jgi:photosystem II stability/assembly factor-like uncharacterized protein